ncbi:MAG: hypothetical protein M1818_005235 [Claussenomyces sp. TS43310]|nr:MAG: hypothetical protein M1818_005235 [Claussenomyces sp. TS43310]
MAPNTLDFTCAIVTGGGGGLGRAMAEHLVALGKKVILVGRTEAKLQQAARELGHDTTYYVLDTGKVPDIAPFVARVTAEHPDVDCLINNAGVQRPLDVAANGSRAFDLAKADQEVAINITGPMHLCVGLLPHLRSRPAATLINVSSVLGYIPFSIINPVYNGTKAWLHFWTMNLRSQLRQAGVDNVRVVEIVPPTVATDLHRERSDPDDNKKDKNSNALSVDEFMEFVSRGWRENRETIGAGSGEKIVQRWYDEFGPDYAKAAGE